MSTTLISILVVVLVLGALYVMYKQDSKDYSSHTTEPGDIDENEPDEVDIPHGK